MNAKIQMKPMSHSLKTRISQYLIAQAQHGDLWAMDILRQWEQEVQENLQFETGLLSKTQSFKLTSDRFSSSAESEFPCGMSYPSEVVKYN